MNAMEFIRQQTHKAMVNDGYNEQQAQFIADYVLDEYRNGRMTRATQFLTLARQFGKQQYQTKD